MKLHKTLNKITLLSWISVLIVLISASFYEKIHGTDNAYLSFYGAWWFVALWCVTTILSVCYLFQRKLFKRPIVFLLHCSFVVILLGALTTYCTSVKGTMHVELNNLSAKFTTQDNVENTLPFNITLNSFNVICYEGTSSPADYKATITISDSDGGILEKGDISMNHILTCKGYRFYQSGYDENLQGCTFLVAHDPWGIGITYCGYTLLFLSLLLFILFDRKYHALVRSVINPKAIIGLLLLCSSCSNPSQPIPNVLPKEVAAEFGELYVYYNGRISPLQTLAKDFTVKLYGSSTYRNYTPEQVFTGWMFYYSDWKEQSMIKIKSSEVRKLLGLQSQYASLIDFRGEHNEYKLEKQVALIARGEYEGDNNGVILADEKFNLITSFYSGKLMKIYPYHSNTDSLRIDWFSQGDRLPNTISDKEWFFIKKSWDYVFELVITKKYDELSAALSKIKKYQQKIASNKLPSPIRFEAEKLYNQYVDVRFLAFPALIIGLIGFIYFCFCTATRRRFTKVSIAILLSFATIMGIVLSTFICLRWVISAHIPLSNGAETMQFLALCSLILTLVLFRKFNAILPFGLIICGLSLMVSIIGDNNPQITLLMPVLSSPLLSIHVAVIMIAYTLLAFMMFNGLAAVVLNLSKNSNQQEIINMYSFSRILLIPAVFCLAIGIFIGAIWANVSWGTYWNWDPKETWALITMLIYASALHLESISLFKKPMAFHLFSIIAFLTVVITYFGVNYFLGGMHSYAG